MTLSWLHYCMIQLNRINSIYFADRWAITLRIVKLFEIKIDGGGRKKNTYLNLSLRFNDSLLLRTTCWEDWFYSLTKLHPELPLYTKPGLPALCRKLHPPVSIYMKSTSLISLKTFWKCILWVSHQLNLLFMVLYWDGHLNFCCESIFYYAFYLFFIESFLKH